MTKKEPTNPLPPVIKPGPFFATYAPSVRDWRHKMNGKNGRGNPCGFNAADLAAIGAGLERMAGEMIENK